MLGLIPKLTGAWVAVQRLRGATRSATTRAQWKGPGWLVMAPVVVVAVAGQVWPDSPLGVVGTQEVVVAVLLWALSPLAARIAGKLEPGSGSVTAAGVGNDLDEPGAAGFPSSPPTAVPGSSVESRATLWVERVGRYAQSGWTNWKGTGMDAVYEGWDLGVTAVGEVWDLHELRKVGVVGEPVVDGGVRGRAMKKLREGLDAIERGEVG